MNLSKVEDYFRPTADKIHIIGCGSVGSSIAEMLARCGCTNFVLYDFDHVEAHNLANQMFRESDIGQLKTDAVKDIICDINPMCRDTVKTVPKGWHGETLNGFVFLAVDNIEIRKNIVEKHMYNERVKAMFDVRTMLEQAQHYAADWISMEQKKKLLSTMQFSHDEAAASTPTSACGVTLGVAPTVRGVCTLAVANYINFVRTGKLKTFVMFDIFGMTLDAFE